MRTSIVNEDDIQQIAPFLYVGSRYAATGRLSAGNYSDYLSLYNIKIVISILTEEEFADFMIESADFAEQCWVRLVADDDPQEPICRYFQQTSAIIADSIKNKEACLVHCAAGMSRSISLIAAYLIAECNMTVAEAITYIKNKRAFAQPNSGFMIQLMGWEKQSKALPTTVRP
jgi:atypical dual specificity phosphatase